MSPQKDHLCPVEKAGHLDSPWRKWLQNPQRILGPCLTQGMRALDVGCGPGAFTTTMADLVGPEGSVVALDCQQAMLDMIHKKVAGTPLEERIICQLCERTGMQLQGNFDFCLAFYVVHELPDQPAFFNELAAHMKPGAKALLAEPRLFHVSKSAFSKTLACAQAAGFAPHPGPKVLLSHTAILVRQ